MALTRFIVGLAAVRHRRCRLPHERQPRATELGQVHALKLGQLLGTFQGSRRRAISAPAAVLRRCCCLLRRRPRSPRALTRHGRTAPSSHMCKHTQLLIPEVHRAHTHAGPLTCLIEALLGLSMQKSSGTKIANSAHTCGATLTLPAAQYATSTPVAPLIVQRERAGPVRTQAACKATQPTLAPRSQPPGRKERPHA
jgi:hypothetical protein